jgi:hypothetical protein
MQILRLVGRAVAAALAASATCLAGLVVFARLHGDALSAEDLSGFGMLSFVIALALAALVYEPAVRFARRRRWSRRKFVAVTVLVLNLPAYAFLLLGMRRGMLAGVSEAALFAAAFAAGGWLFVYMSEMDI